MDKKCEICGIFMKNVHHATRYCEQCKLLSLKEINIQTLKQQTS